jgi:tetratricopeptide (TPR) repeat protein
MATSFPPRTNAPPGLPVNVSAHGHVRVLQAELDTEADIARKAALEYEIASITEHKLNEPESALAHYIASLSLREQFRPTVLALMRIYETGRSFVNLERLFQQEIRTALTPEERSIAMVHVAILLADRLGDPHEALLYLQQAWQCDPDNRIAALMLEHHYFRADDPGAAERVIERRAERVADQELKAALLWELAAEREIRGEINEAIIALRDAVSQTQEKWRSLELIERLARDQYLPDLIIEALEARATLTAQAPSAQDELEGPTAKLIQRLGGVKQTVDHGAVLWREVARSRIAFKSDAVGAVAAYERALAIVPGDLLVRYEHMEALRAAGDQMAAAQAAEGLLERNVTGRFGAALHFRLAQEARSRGDEGTVRSALSAAVRADPESAAALASLEDVWFDAEAFEELVTHLEARAQRAEGESASEHFWRAGFLAAERLGDAPRAARLLQAAAAARGDREPVLRERYHLALRFADPLEASQAAEELTATETLDESERSALYRERYQLERYARENQGDADAWLRFILNDTSCNVWAPDAARLDAAIHQRHDLLAEAHRALAERSEQDQVAAAHLSAAGRAWLFSGNEEAAAQCLKQAMVRVPASPYAAALLEEILLARGAAEEVASLLIDTAQARASNRQGVYSLLYAGMAAEDASETKLAERCYQDATDQHPAALAPLWALKRLGEKTGQRQLVLRALELLAARESKRGAPASAAVQLAQYYELMDKGELAIEPLKSSLYDQQVGLASALCLTLLPYRLLSGFERDAAWARLGQTATGDFAAAVARARAAATLGHDPHQARRMILQLTNDYPQDRSARLMAIESAADADERGEAFIELGRVTNDPNAKVDLILHGLRVSGYKPLAEATADPLTTASEIARAYPESTAATIALDEASSAGGRGASRADALRRRMDGADEMAKGSLRAAYSRALLGAGRFQEAAAQAQACVLASGADLASWETLRVAARATGDWSAVARACDTLAEYSDTDFRAMLLEESASVLFLYLGREQEAEQRLRAVLEITPSRKPAFELLYQILIQRNDTEGLLALLSEYIESIHDAAEIVGLLFDQARLYHRVGDQAGALTSLERLFDLDPAHAGALSLKAQVHISLKQWGEAVEALKALSETPIETEQRRLALTGAVDLLENKLGDLSGAYDLLAALAKRKPVEVAIYAKMAHLALGASRYREAAEALSEAASAVEPEQRALFEGYAGQIFAGALGDRAAAIGAYRRALSASPTDETACHALAQLIADPTERAALLRAYEDAVREQLTPRPTDPKLLRKLYQVAVWQDDRDLQYLVLNALSALKLATPEELTLADTLIAGAPKRAVGVLSEASVTALQTPDPRLLPAELVALLSAAASSLDALSPSFYGASRDQRIDRRDENEVRDEVYGVVLALGLELGEFYWGGNDSKRIAIIAREGNAHTWVVGREVESPLSALQRLAVAERAMAARLGVAPFMWPRSNKEAVELAGAAAIAVDFPLTGFKVQASNDANSLAIKLGKAIPRKLRKELRATLTGFSGGIDAVTAFFTGTRDCVRRVGLLFSGDLSVVLDEVLGPAFDQQAVNGSAEAMDLIRLSTSTQLLSLRREIGLAL